MTAAIGILQTRDLACLARHRTRADWYLCERDASTMWLQLPLADADELARLPLLDSWELRGELLYRPGHQVPERHLSGQWQPLEAVLPLGRVLRSMPGMLPLPIGFALVPTGDLVEPQMLFADFQVLCSWADTVLAQRLTRLAMCLRSDGHCLVKGSPLPGIPGEGLHRVGRLLLPAGYGLPRYIWPELIESATGVDSSDLVCLEPGGDWSIIPATAWLSVDRAVLRVNQVRD